ncbi:MAG: hypothetical protein WC059_01410 [Candidatus Paceibacterota bacterium]
MEKQKPVSISYFERPEFKTLREQGFEEGSTIGHSIIMENKNGEVVLFNKDTGQIDHSYDKNKSMEERTELDQRSSSFQ